MGDGLFSQHGPDGIFNSGEGPPNDASSPVLDSDGTPLRDSLAVTYPSPGHMRVARARRNPHSGQVEMQEAEREPTPAEVEFLKNKGVTVGPGSMVTTQVSMPPLGATATVDPATGLPVVESGAKKTIKTVAKVVGVLAVGAALFYAGNRWVLPMVMGDDAPPKRRRRARTQPTRAVDDDFDD